MAEAGGIDTSSYRLPTTSSPLETAGKLGALQSQQLGIDKQKLDLLNQHFNIMNSELSTLANDPDVTKDKVIGRLNSIADMLNMPQQVRQKMLAEFAPLTSQQEVKKHLDYTLLRGADTQQRLNEQYGKPGVIDTGQQIQPTRTGLRGGPLPVGGPIQIQEPPTTVVTTPEGPRRAGPQPPKLPVGFEQQPGGIPGQIVPSRVRALPVGPVTSPAVPGPSTNFGGTVTGAEVGPNTANARVAQGFEPVGSKAGQAPMFEEGQKQLANDQELATQKLTAIKPALQALPLLKDLRTGPTTEGFNKAVAILKANNIIPTTANDPTAIYQEVNKKLSQYVASSPVGQRSDAAQTLAEASSPSPKTQINPALIKLTKDAIILDRVQAARPNAFEGNDLSKYGKHRSTFPASVDERAFGLDLMEPEERNKLLQEMKKKQNTAEGKKFLKSLEIVDRLGYIDTGR